MEEQGLIEHAPEDSLRKRFVATAPGRERVAADEEKVAALRVRLEALAKTEEMTDPAPVRRAMHSIKSAVVDRLSHSAADRETILRIAEILDEATRQIERIEL